MKSKTLILLLMFNLFYFVTSSKIITISKITIFNKIRKIIEDEIAKVQTDSVSLDSINDLTSKSHYREIKTNIERIIILNLEFWSQLSEERPGKLLKKKNNY